MCVNGFTSQDAELELLKSIISTLPQSMFLLDSDRYILAIYNVDATVLAGRKVSDIVGKHLSVFSEDSESPFFSACQELNKIFDHVLTTGEPARLLYQIVGGMHFEANVSRVVGNRILSVVRNISDIIAKRQLVEYRNRVELSLALTAGGSSSWRYDVANRLVSSDTNNDIFDKEITFDDLIDKIAPEHRSIIFKMFDDVLSGVEHASAKIQVVDKNKELCWYSINAVAHEDSSDGGATVVVGSQKNVTHEYLNQEKLNALVKQNALIMNNVNSGFAYITPDYTVQWENVSQVLPEALISSYRAGVCCYKSLGKDAPCERCAMQRALASQNIERSEYMTADGEMIEVYANPIVNADYETEGIVMRYENITERKRTFDQLKKSEEKIAESNKLQATIFENMPCALFIKDADDDYRYIVANKLFCQFVGIDKNIVGSTDADIFTPRDAEKFRLDDVRIMEQGVVQVFEETTTAGSGNTVVWHTTKSPFVSSDNRHLLLGISLDITEKSRAFQELATAKERAERSDMLKSAFLANMSHEIRTPLNALVGFSQLLYSVEEEEERDTYISIINSNCEILLNLINDILDLSKIESGYIDCNNSQFNLAELCSELSVSIMPRVKPGVQLVCKTPHDRCFVSLDKSRVAQVINNFLTNAVKFTTQGYIEIGYLVIDDGVKVYVKDTGCGIEKDFLDKVFERFEKFNTFEQGTGLGMSICKAIVDAYSGKIGVESEFGKGSMFWAWMPTQIDVEWIDNRCS